MEEAIEEGLEKLGLPEDAVEIEILDEGAKGIFGLGSRQTRIRLTVKNGNQNGFQNLAIKISANLSDEKHTASDTGDDEDDEI